MGCFLACFGSSKARKRRKNPANKVLPRDQRNGFYEPLKPTISSNQDGVENPISSTSESRDKLEEQLSFGARKKVTFDLNVKTYEEVSTQEITDNPVESDGEKERGKKEEQAAKQSRLSPANSADDSTGSSMGSYPSNHRYQNCSHSDNEYDESEGEESDLDDEDDDEFCDDEEEDDDRQMGGESSESFFSLPTELKPGRSSTQLDEKEVNSPVPVAQNARDRSHYVHSVLNPVENLTQWKAVKAKAAPTPLNPQKENANLEELHIPFSSEPSFKSSPLSWKKTSFNQSTTPLPSKQEVAVDASLSNWLSSTETTPSIKTSNISIGFESADRSLSPRSASPTSLEDRPILGALTVEELKQLAASSSPRRSPTWSPDEMPILGTVGSYWSQTEQTNTNSSSGSSCRGGGIPNTTSKYTEDKRVNWYSTPFETRLERALNTGAAEAYSSCQRRV